MNWIIDWIIFILAGVCAAAILAGLFKWGSGMIVDMCDKAKSEGED